ncbi:CPBP family intramembrane glutamic endopeptidase [Thermobifida halotolerans]|uniref:CPBP family intramembrane glutamic endopeptidase n=1 Tax=Thermobifida halotolerans TaxID=483545 RepID=UPI001FB3A777|nr:CPBP family intramembrane glutamic endopeptidase [Thermobifida halotolerans]
MARRPRTVEPPPGVPYHRMARTETHRWWKPPLTLGLAVLLVLGMTVFTLVVVELVKAIQRIPEDVELFGDPVADLAVNLLALALMIPAVMVAVRVVQKRRIGSLASVEGRLRWPWLLRCAVVATVSVAVSFGILSVLYLLSEPGEPLFGEYVGARRFALAVVVVVLLVPFQAAAEEYALRGFLMQMVGAYGSTSYGDRRPGPVAVVNRVLASPVPAILVSGLVFTVMHDYSGWATAEVALFGLAMAWLVWYTGGLEAAITLHVAHNVVAFVLSAYEGLPDPSGSIGSWQGVVATALQLGLFCLVVVWMARRARVRRTTPDPHAALPPPPGGETAGPGHDHG